MSGRYLTVRKRLLQPPGISGEPCRPHPNRTSDISSLIGEAVTSYVQPVFTSVPKQLLLPKLSYRPSSYMTLFFNVIITHSKQLLLKSAYNFKSSFLVNNRQCFYYHIHVMILNIFLFLNFIIRRKLSSIIARNIYSRTSTNNTGIIHQCSSPAQLKSPLVMEWPGYLPFLSIRSLLPCTSSMIEKEVQIHDDIPKIGDVIQPPKHNLSQLKNQHLICVASRLLIDPFSWPGAIVVRGCVALALLGVAAGGFSCVTGPCQNGICLDVTNT